jgi:DNA-binding PadR family transcriptional regulator
VEAVHRHQHRAVGAQRGHQPGGERGLAGPRRADDAEQPPRAGRERGRAVEQGCERHRATILPCCAAHSTMRHMGDAFDKLELELRRGVVVLATLSQLHTLRYGYELRQSLVAGGMPIEEGTLYPLLRRLEAQGVLTSEWRTDAGSPRRYYTLSAEGRRLYARLTDSWRGLNDTMDQLLKIGDRDQEGDHDGR